MSNFKSNRQQYNRHKELSIFAVGDKVEVKFFGKGTVTEIVNDFMIRVKLDRPPPIDFSVLNPCALLSEWAVKIEPVP